MLSETEKEMLQTKEVCDSFEFARTKELAERIGTKRIVFTGMGSSLLFPGNHAKNRALLLGIENKVEAYFASDLFQYNDFKDTIVFCCTNSGRTKETVMIAEHVKKQGGYCVAVTANADSVITKKCDETILLTCGFEKGVAATKSVVEQGLVYDSLIFHLAALQGKQIDFARLKEELMDVGAKIISNVNIQLPEETVVKMTKAMPYLVAGKETGVAEEIALKIQETTKKLAVFYADTELVHGPAEAIDGGCILLFEPMYFANNMNEFSSFAEKTNSLFLRVGKNTEVNTEINETFKQYCLLAAGWGIIRHVVNALAIDVDHPTKIQKVGNPYMG